MAEGNSQRVDPDQLMEQAALLFYKHTQYAAAASVFSLLVMRTPNHPMAWFGLGQAIMFQAQQSLDVLDLVLAVSCFKRALHNKADNQMADEAIHIIIDRSPLTQELVEAVRPFGSQFQRLLAFADFTPDQLYDALKTINDWKERTQIVMFLGEQNMPILTPLLIGAIRYDPHPDVVMAALKRIGRMGDQPGVRECLEEIVATERWRDVEPYVSIALSAIHAPWSTSLQEQIERKKSSPSDDKAS
ncbi:MAG: HEAT repeat domain-containing protein [Chloroflexi bacterium]|nr:HEAT repeat domain-containing protein [Chloroflexota bacterium]